MMYIPIPSTYIIELNLVTGNNNNNNTNSTQYKTYTPIHIVHVYTYIM